jgi:hypothetical protein
VALCGDFFVGVSLAFVLYSFYEEWQQHRLAKKHLAKMRKDFALVVVGMWLWVSGRTIFSWGNAKKK